MIRRQGDLKTTLLMFAFIGSALACSLVFGQSSENSISKFEKSVSNLRNQRYCEVLYGNRKFLNLVVKVFNTQGLNHCPEGQWKDLTKESVEKTHNASFVLLNGPRYWTMDEIQAGGNTVNNIQESFGGIEMNLRATVTLGLMKQLIGSQNYSPNEIMRTTNFIYKSGTAVYELISPVGEVYMMQSYSQIINPKLEMRDLPGLAKQLQMPSGWKYQTRKLQQDLSLKANGIAYVLQDNLKNSYQRR